MQNNKDLIKQRLTELYIELLNPCLSNANEVTQAILAIYSSPSSIPVLIDLINSENLNFKKLASFGLKYSLESCSSQLNPSEYNEVWKNLFIILINENDEQNINIILAPLMQMFRLSNYEWPIVEEFINSLSQTNLKKCFHITSSLLPFVSPDYVISRFDYFSSMINSSFMSPNNLELFYFTFYIFFILANNVVKDHSKIYDNLIKKVTVPFSKILIALLSNEQLFLNSITVILDAFDFLINPFSLELLFLPIIENLKNSNVPLRMKYSIILLFSGILRCDSTFVIDVQTLQQLIALSIPLSIELFNNSVDLETPDSFIFIDFFYQCLNRIPNENLRKVTDPFIQSLSNPQTPPLLYNLLIFFNACLKRSTFLFENEFTQIVAVLVNCLQVNHPGVRSEAAYVLCSQKDLYESIEKEKLFQIILMVIEILKKSDFASGFTILSLLTDDIDDSDPIFEPLYVMCNQIIKNFSETDSSLTEIAWKILNNIVKNSEKIVFNVFDNLYAFCVSFITQYIASNNDEKQLFVHSMVKCLSSLSKSCCEKMIEKLKEVFPLLVALLNKSNDFKIRKSILKCFESFINKMPNDIELYIYSFLKSNFMETLSQASIKALSNSIIQRDYFVYIIAPSINLLAEILKKYPHFFNNDEMLLYLLKVFDMGIDCIYTKGLIASLHLFKRILIFMARANLILPNVVIKYTTIILNKMEREIDEKVICSMFDVIHKAISIFGNSIIFEKEASLFQFVLKCVDSNQNQFTNEIKYNHVYNDKALNLLASIIRSYYDDENKDKSTTNNFDLSLVQNFIPRILRILNDNDPLFTAFGLNLMSQIAISTNLLSPEVLAILIQKSLFYIEKQNSLTIPSIILIDSLTYHYPHILEKLAQQLVILIETQVASLNCSIDYHKCLSEYLISLLTILDKHSNNLINEQKMKMILSNLPIIFSKSFNNKHIYLFLLRHLNDFDSLQFEIMKNIMIVFESAETINDSSLTQELINNLLIKILQSGILNNQNALTASFDNQTDRIQSFLRTITFLSQHQIIES